MASWGWSFGLTGALKNFPGGEKLGIKLKLRFSWGLVLAELGNKAELDQLELWLNWSLEDFPRWGGEKLGIKLKLSFSWGLGLAELGKNYR